MVGCEVMTVTSDEAWLISVCWERWPKTGCKGLVAMAIWHKLFISETGCHVAEGKRLTRSWITNRLLPYNRSFSVEFFPLSDKTPLMHLKPQNIWTRCQYLFWKLMSQVPGVAECLEMLDKTKFDDKKAPIQIRGCHLSKRLSAPTTPLLTLENSFKAAWTLVRSRRNPGKEHF